MLSNNNHVGSTYGLGNADIFDPSLSLFVSAACPILASLLRPAWRRTFETKWRRSLHWFDPVVLVHDPQDWRTTVGLDWV